MRASQKEYVGYKDQRDALFVFGAGASTADGGPLQRDLLPHILNTKHERSATVELVKRFIEDNFDVSSGHYPSLESIFGFLDYFISKQESLGKGYTTASIAFVKEALIRLVHYSIDGCSKSKGVYKRFWEVVANTNRNISVLTMNYDTLLDESFDFLYPDKAVIDYCLNFMNYEHYDRIEAFNWWDNPREPITVWEGGDPRPIKIMKIHGSLNWKYCNCCNQVLLTPWDTKISLESQGFKGRTGRSCENPESIEYDLRCPIDDTLFDTFIVPPSHIKNLSHPAVTKLMDEAAIEIRKASRVVFVGYSFPEADVHVKALFKKNLTDGVSIEVVDPFLNSQLEANYRSLSKSVKFVKAHFEEYIGNGLEAALK
ncbi:hypothetical protein [Pontibacter cellulosilyticus]|uniref:Uncharacterized protein n=1 Tax=Pontibacter cellulosilyticus TaxID=1720253 RepID=A0A923SJL4_9BACT|nr:hypothetical protein [Pontibacter cellulosilyticus]MBC5994014.1 hypothetical protein [Pontibacter cellulosilyticus]